MFEFSWRRSVLDNAEGLYRAALAKNKRRISLPAVI